MDKMKWIWIICLILTLASIAISIVSVVLIADLAEKAEDTAEKTEDFCEAIEERVKKIEQTVNIISANITASLTDQPNNDADVEADVLFDSLTIRETNGKIAIYTADGLLLRTLDISVNTLPAADQSALATGITVNSWRELIALIEDLE